MEREWDELLWQLRHCKGYHIGPSLCAASQKNNLACFWVQNCETFLKIVKRSPMNSLLWEDDAKITPSSQSGVFFCFKMGVWKPNWSAESPGNESVIPWFTEVWTFFWYFWPFDEQKCILWRDEMKPDFNNDQSKNFFSWCQNCLYGNVHIKSREFKVLGYGAAWVQKVTARLHKLGRKRIFQQDNDQKHTPNSTREFLKKKKQLWALKVCFLNFRDLLQA